MDDTIIVDDTIIHDNTMMINTMENTNTINCPGDILMYADPNLYLKQSPTLNQYYQIRENIEYSHFIITRFSFRFKKTDPVGDLFKDDRMNRRFDLFEAFCFPSIIKQSNPNFYWIIITDLLLPNKYMNKLNYLIAKFYNSDDYKTHGPRQIFVHKWNYQYTMSDPLWINNQVLPIITKYLITTRFDDDDSLSNQFIQLIADELSTPINGFRLISYQHGYYWYPHPNLEYGLYKPSIRPFIAIGLSMIVEYSKYPITIYFGNHTKLAYFIKNPEDHKLIKKLYTINNDYVDDNNYPDRVNLVKISSPIYIRTVHDYNLQKNERSKYLNITTTKLTHTDNSAMLTTQLKIQKNFNLNHGMIKTLNDNLNNNN
jgi:hypothetical protein